MSYEARYDMDQFELYNAARRFRKKTYQLFKYLPPEEKYCLGTQMRRAAVSVSNNIAEGHGRWQYLENIHFCSIRAAPLMSSSTISMLASMKNMVMPGFPRN